MVMLMLMGIVGCSAAMAQAVAFRLEIPPGVSLESQVLKPTQKEGFDAFLWVEMVARENIQLLVSLRDETGSFSNSPIYILNDGSANFANAREVTRGYIATTMMQRGTLVHNIRPKTNQVSTWIGIPSIKGLATTIEYF